MKTRRLVIPLRDIKFTLSEEVSYLLSISQSNKIVQPDDEESKIKEEVLDEDIISEEDTKSIENGGKFKAAKDVKERQILPTKRTKSDSSGKPEAAIDVIKQTHPGKRTKYIENNENSSFGEVSKDSKEISINEDSTTDEDIKEEINIGKDSAIDKNAKEEIKIGEESTTDECTKDNSEDPDSVFHIKMQAHPRKRIKYNKIESDEDSNFDEGTKDTDNSDKPKAPRDATTSTRRAKYKRIKSNEDSEFEGDSRSSQDSEEPKAKRGGKESKHSAEKPIFEEIIIDKDNTTDDDITVIDSEEPKRRSGRTRRCTGRPKYGEIDSDEDGESVGEIGTDEDEEFYDKRRYKQRRVKTRPKRSNRKLKYDQYESEENSTSENTNSGKSDSEEEPSFNGETTTSEENSSQSSSYGESSCSEESETSAKENKRRSSTKNAKKGPLSEYEKLIEKKRAEKMAFLQSIKMDEVKEDFKKVIEKVKIKKKKVKRDKEMSPTETLAQRSRGRVTNKEVNYSEDALYDKLVQEAEAVKEASIRQVMPAEMSFEDALELDDFYKYYLEDIKIQEPRFQSDLISYDKSVLEELVLKYPRHGVFKLETAHPSSYTVPKTLAWYPSPESLILAAGCTSGMLSFWNVNAGTDPYIFKNHLRGISHMQFNPFYHNQIISSSSDGTLRSGDMVGKVFKELYSAPVNITCHYFDFLSESSYIVAQANGQVAIVDVRTDGKQSEKLHRCHDLAVRSVSVNPVNKSSFVTADSKGCIRLWDLKMLQDHPVASIKRKNRGIQMAYFSPVTGNSILVSSLYGVSLYDSRNITCIWLRKEKRIPSKNIERSIKANWLLNSEQAFYMPNNGNTGGIIVYDTNFNIFHTITHVDLSGSSHTIAFHPFRPAIAVGRQKNAKVSVLS